MPFDRYFNEAASTQLVIDPYADKVIGANRESAHLLGLMPAQIRRCPASRLFAPNLPALIVFSQQLIEQGRAWCDFEVDQPGNRAIGLAGFGRDENPSFGRTIPGITAYEPRWSPRPVILPVANEERGR